LPKVKPPPGFFRDDPQGKKYPVGVIPVPDVTYTLDMEKVELAAKRDDPWPGSKK
jgi:hypothetical protein